MQDTSIMEKFHQQVLEKPESFFAPSEDLAVSIKQCTKYLFELAKQAQPSNGELELDTLYVDGFDADQIWEQLKLQNEPIAKEATRNVKKWTKKSNELSFFATSEKNDNDNESDNEVAQEEVEVNEDDVNDVDDVDEEGDEDNEDEMIVEEEEDEDDDDDLVEKPQVPSKSKSKKRKRRNDGVEDGFFNWDEMEKAAEEEEENESDMENDEVLSEDEDAEDEDGDNDIDDEDFEDEDDDNIDEKTATYKDLFDEPNSNDELDDEEEAESNDEEEIESKEDKKSSSGKRKAQTEEEEEDEAERGILSTHQRRSSHLQQQIKQLEDEALGDKPWELRGEVKASVRPENSLLEATLEYDRPTKVAPIITVEVTQALEELIKQRIRDEQYDDVIRKFAVNETAQKEATELSMEKSKEGLGEIYEKEYMKTAMGFEDNSEMKKEQEEIDVLFKKLCWKLDALTNFHFTPKPVVREMQVQTAAPAISMEEAVPIGVSDANLQAPEDVYDKKHKRDGIVRSREEMSQDERRAERNAKKNSRRKARKQRESDEKLVAKINPGMGNKFEKRKMLESLEAKNVTKGKEIEGSTRQFSNSSEFFSRLQEEQQTKGSKSYKDTKKDKKNASFYKM